MRKMEKLYEQRRREFREIMKALTSSLVDLKSVMLQDHKDVDDTGTLGRKIGLGNPDEPYSLARFDEFANGAALEGKGAIPSQVDNSPPGRPPGDEEYTQQMRMFQIFSIRYGRLRQRKPIGGPPVSAKLRELYRQVERRRAELAQQFGDWKRTRPEAALHELQRVKLALDHPIPPAEEKDLILYALSRPLTPRC